MRSPETAQVAEFPMRRNILRAARVLPLWREQPFYAKVDIFTSLSDVRSLTRFFNALFRAPFSNSGICPFS